MNDQDRLTAGYTTINQLSPEHREEILGLMKNQPDDSWLPVNLYDGFVFSIPLLLICGGVLVAYWYSELHRRIGTLEIDNLMLIIPTLCFFGIWMFILTLCMQLIYGRSNAWVLSKSGLVRVMGKGLRIYPYGMIEKVSAKSGVGVTTYYDPSTGRTGLAPTQAEVRQQNREGKNALVGRTSSSPAGFLYLYLRGVESPVEEIFTPGDRPKECSAFMKLFRERIAEAPAEERPFPMDSRKIHTILEIYLRSLPVVAVIVVLGLIYGFYPWHNRTADAEYARYYLFGHQPARAENLTAQLNRLSDYVEFFEEGDYRQMVWEKTQTMIKAKIASLSTAVERGEDVKHNKNLIRYRQADLRRLCQKMGLPEEE